MTQRNEKPVKKGTFKVAYSSAKRYACEKGELTLTTKNLLINCEGNWSKTFPIIEIRLEAWEENLEIYDIWYGKLLFKLIVDESKEWKEAFDKVNFEWASARWDELFERSEKRQTELKKLLDLNPRH